MSAAIFAAAFVGDTAALQVLNKLLNCGANLSDSQFVG